MLKVAPVIFGLALLGQLSGLVEENVSFKKRLLWISATPLRNTNSRVDRESKPQEVGLKAKVYHAGCFVRSTPSKAFRMRRHPSVIYDSVLQFCTQNGLTCESRPNMVTVVPEQVSLGD
jgi:hypothetical protein